MDLKGIGWGDVDWILLGPVAGSCGNGNEPLGSIKGWKFLY
jgi:hypothetical protein